MDIRTGRRDYHHAMCNATFTFVNKSTSTNQSCNPEPDPLEEIPWDLLWPLPIFGIERRLPARNISILCLDEGRALPNLPEGIEAEVDRYANVC